MRRQRTSNFLSIAALFVALGALPAQAQYVGPGAVETSQFGESTFDIGSLTPSTGALPQDLWNGTEAEDFSYLVDNLPRSYDHPAELDLLRRTLLSPGPGPDGADTELTAKKLLAVAEAGFYEEAASLAELSGGLSGRPALSQAIAYADMLRGDLVGACQRGANLQTGRSEAFWLKLRLLCYSVNGENAAADLTLGLLREKGNLTGNEDAMFSALALGVVPDQFAPPVTGFDYVAAREMGAEFNPRQLNRVSGVILRAVANDPEAPLESRAHALYESLYMGVIQPSDARSIVRSLDLPPELVATARDRLADAPDDPLTALVVFQAAGQMNAPEFTIDRADLIGDALQSARTAKEFTVMSYLFAPMAEQIEVVVNYTPYAIEFALAGIVARNDTLTRNWIGALTADQANPAGASDAGILLSLLALRDPELAEEIGYRSGVEVVTIEPEWALDTQLGGNMLPGMVRVGLNTARSGAEGQAALSWLILAHTNANGPMEDIRAMLLDDAEGVLDSVDITGELAFEAALKEAVAGLVTSRPDGPAGEGEATGPAARIQPRVKPDGDE